MNVFWVLNLCEPGGDASFVPQANLVFFIYICNYNPELPPIITEQPSSLKFYELWERWTHGKSTCFHPLTAKLLINCIFHSLECVFGKRNPQLQVSAN